MKTENEDAQRLIDELDKRNEDIDYRKLPSAQKIIEEVEFELKGNRR